MVDPHRVIRLFSFFFLVLILGASVTLVHAETTALKPVWHTQTIASYTSSGVYAEYDTYMKQAYSSIFNVDYGSTAEIKSAIDAKPSTHTFPTSWSCTKTSSSAGDNGFNVYFSCTWPNHAGSVNWGGLVNKISGCDTAHGWTQVGSSCYRPDCLPGQVRDANGICKNDCKSKADTVVSQGFYDLGVDDNNTMENLYCYQGCDVYFSGIGSAVRKDRTRIPPHFYAQGKLEFGSTTCNEGDGPPSPTDPDPSCGATQGTATMGGQTICVDDPGKIPSIKKSTSVETEKSGDGTTTKKSTTTETECKDGNCTIKQYTTGGGDNDGGGGGSDGVGDGSGEAGSGTEKDESQDTFCEENPTSPLCKDNSFSGSCDNAAAPACDGDAVACATAAAVFEMNCNAKKEPTSAAYVLGKSISEGGPDSVVSPLDPSQVTDIDVGSIIGTAAGHRTLSGQCIPNISISTHFGSFGMDTTLFCQFASIVGYLLVAAASIHAIKMIAGAS